MCQYYSLIPTGYADYVNALVRGFSSRLYYNVLIIPSRWHGYQRQYTHISWCMCCLYTMQLLGGLTPEGVEVSNPLFFNGLYALTIYNLQREIRTLGCVLFAIFNTIHTFSIYTLYFITVHLCTSSWIQSTIQLLFLVLPDLINGVQSAMRIYSYCPTHLQRTGTSTLVITRR